MLYELESTFRQLMGKKRVNRNLRTSWNLDRHMSSETLGQNMDESERVDASLVTRDYEGGFNDPLLETPSKGPPGKKIRDSNNASLAEIFNTIQSINSKQDSVIQKITHIESSTEVTIAAVNSLSDTVNRLLSDVAFHGEKTGGHSIIWMEAKSFIYLRENGLHIKEFLSKADTESRNKLWPLPGGLKGREEGRFQWPLCCY
ncbi:tRNA (adenine(9)-N1)-methyltransferase [Labeo rohita]|uniref:tRNA (Adenine(9)-N1)-methyltransferase n=1 Tax=Labeo rohita TaxID=84645 RepID=A0ABQ8L511_LABRO|nr:tRNA (adenine(9)-N1)-methyltransferase [Labeo rohita]